MLATENLKKNNGTEKIGLVIHAPGLFHAAFTMLPASLWIRSFSLINHLGCSNEMVGWDDTACE